MTTGLIFGIIPGIHVTKGNLGDMLRKSGWTGGSGRSESIARSSLAVAEVSLAFMLLNGAGLLLASFLQILSVDPGFDPQQVITARLSLPASRYASDEAIPSFADYLQASLTALPEVVGAGITTVLPLTGDGNKSVVTVEGYELAPGESVPTPHNSWVTGGYFAGMGIPVLEGRVFDAHDGAETPLVAVVDRVFAERYWPGHSPIGRRVHRGGGSGQWLTIVGVVGDSKFDELVEENKRGALYFCQNQPSERVYLPLRREMSLIVRTGPSELSLVSAIGGAVRELDAQLPLFDVKPMDERLCDSLKGRRVPMMLLLIFGGVALILVSVGIYGVLAHGVSQRTREIGVRIAMGATPQTVMKQVLWQGAELVSIGLAAGSSARSD